MPSRISPVSASSLRKLGLVAVLALVVGTGVTVRHTVRRWIRHKVAAVLSHRVHAQVATIDVAKKVGAAETAHAKAMNAAVAQMSGDARVGGVSGAGVSGSGAGSENAVPPSAVNASAVSAGVGDPRTSRGPRTPAQATMLAQATPSLAATGPDFGIAMPEPPHYTYNADNRRDPFQSLLQGEFMAEYGENGQPLVDVAELKLMGVLARGRERFAMVEDSKRHGFALRVGDPVINGRVTGITDQTITFNLSSYGETQTVKLHMINPTKAGN